MKQRNLRQFNTQIMNVEDIEAMLSTITIFEKIDFSNISKEQVRAKLEHLKNTQVPNRDVLLNMEDRAVTFYWFKNWLHPDLKHWVTMSPRDKRGCSREVLKKDGKRDMLNFYENGQQNFNYTLDDIEDWLQ